MADYIVDFDSLYTKIRKREMVLPEAVLAFKEGRTGGGLCHGSRAEKLVHHESRIFKFRSEALHVSREICASRITKNIFLKSRSSVNEMI